jgi:acetyltransferase-like isoleucine patch superfamily enzyme
MSDRMWRIFSFVHSENNNWIQRVVELGRKLVVTSRDACDVPIRMLVRHFLFSQLTPYFAMHLGSNCNISDAKKASLGKFSAASRNLSS